MLISFTVQNDVRLTPSVLNAVGEEPAIGRLWSVCAILAFPDLPVKSLVFLLSLYILRQQTLSMSSFSDVFCTTCHVHGAGVLCPTDNNNVECSGRGTCNRVTLICLCNAGFSGPSCRVPGNFDLSIKFCGRCGGHNIFEVILVANKKSFLRIQLAVTLTCASQGSSLFSRLSARVF